MATAASNTSSISNSFGVKSKDYIYEDDVCFVFDELTNPQAPIHYVVVPKKRIPRLCAATAEDEKILGHLLLVARRVALHRDMSDGFRVVMNEGDAGTEPDFCVQVLGGHLLLVAKDVAISRGLHRSGYHVVVDEDHRAIRLKSVHVFGRALQHMLWPAVMGEAAGKAKQIYRILQEIKIHSTAVRVMPSSDSGVL